MQVELNGASATLEAANTGASGQPAAMTEKFLFYCSEAPVSSAAEQFTQNRDLAWQFPHFVNPFRNTFQQPYCLGRIRLNASFNFLVRVDLAQSLIRSGKK